MSRIEVEVKLRIDDIAGLGARLERFGARLLHPREFEDNQIYDFPDRDLMRKGSMLRVRVLERGALLTYKGQVRIESGMKVRDEIESSFPAAEGPALLEILSALGLAVIFRYQKYRTTWEIPGLLITLDETPIGSYIELEGERTLIDSTAGRLGYTPDDYITSSYRDLYLQASSGLMGAPDQMIFSA